MHALECHSGAVSFVFIGTYVTVSFDSMRVSATHGKVVRYGFLSAVIYLHTTQSLGRSLRIGWCSRVEDTSAKERVANRVDPCMFRHVMLPRTRSRFLAPTLP